MLTQCMTLGGLGAVYYTMPLSRVAKSDLGFISYDNGPLGLLIRHEAEAKT